MNNIKPVTRLIKPDNEYRVVNYQLAYKSYELIIWPNGNKFYYLDGYLHRENAPAVIHTDGHQVWYYHDKCHNLNGPAIIYSNDVKEYYINNEYYEENEFWIVQKKCFKCKTIFENILDLKIHLEQYNDAKNMIEYIFKLLL